MNENDAPEIKPIVDPVQRVALRDAVIEAARKLLAELDFRLGETCDDTWTTRPLRVALRALDAIEPQSESADG